MEQTSASRLQEQVEIIRPAAVLESRVATQVLNHLRDQDVSLGGVWNASASVWQRYDVPWNGVGGTRGTSVLLGTVAVMYDTPVRHEVTIYRVTVTPAGQELGLRSSCSATTPSRSPASRSRPAPVQRSATCRARTRSRPASPASSARRPLSPRG